MNLTQSQQELWRIAFRLWWEYSYWTPEEAMNWCIKQK